MDNTNALRKEVKIAQDELDTALAEGGDTISARRKLKDAQIELSLVESKENQKAAAVESEEKTARQYEAGTMIKEAMDSLDAHLEKFQLEKPIPQLPIHLAENVLTTRKKLAAAQKEKQAYRSRIDKLRQRHNVLESERAEIVARRLAGQGNDAKDGPRLEVLRADLEGMQSLIERESNATTLQDGATVERVVNEAEAVFQHAIRAEEIRCLKDMVYKLESLLVASATALANIPGARTTDRYQPGPVIRKASADSLL